MIGEKNKCLIHIDTWVFVIMFCGIWLICFSGVPVLGKQAQKQYLTHKPSSLTHLILCTCIISQLMNLPMKLQFTIPYIEKLTHLCQPGMPSPTSRPLLSWT